MKKRLFIPVVVVFVLIGGMSIWERVHRPEPLWVDGKTVQEWLETPDPDVSEILPSDHPLALAGPEIIPDLIIAIERNYRLQDFIDRNRHKFPGFLQSRLPERINPPGSIRTIAAFRLGQFGHSASNAVPTLINLLEDPREQQYTGWKSRVVQALGWIGPPARDAVPVLVDYLSHTNSTTRSWSASALLEIGGVPPEAIRVLKKNLGDPGYLAAKHAVAIWVAEPNAEALDRVKDLLSQRHDYNTRAQTAQALSWVSDLPGELEPILTSMLEDENASVRQGASLALARPGAENMDRILEVLIEGVQNGQFQIPCAVALGNLGSLAVDAIPALEAKTSGYGGYVISTAARNALKKIKAE